MAETVSLGTGRIQLPASLDLTAAAPLAEELHNLLGANIAIDASDVHRVGSQCLQVLLAASISLQNAGHAMLIVTPSKAFSDALSILGLTGHFTVEDADA